jgi:hypothetical protein
MRQGPQAKQSAFVQLAVLRGSRGRFRPQHLHQENVPVSAHIVLIIIGLIEEQILRMVNLSSQPYANARSSSRPALLNSRPGNRYSGTNSHVRKHQPRTWNPRTGNFESSIPPFNMWTTQLQGCGIANPQS